MRALRIENNIVINVAAFDDDAVLPEEWIASPIEQISVGWTVDGEGVYFAPAVAEVVKTAKQIRDEALTALSHDFGDGRIIQTRPQDESKIRNAIEILQANSSITEIHWRMVDNVTYPTTLAELQTAFAAGQMAAMAVWNDYNSNV